MSSSKRWCRRDSKCEALLVPDLEKLAKLRVQQDETATV